MKQQSKDNCNNFQAQTQIFNLNVYSNDSKEKEIDFKENYVVNIHNKVFGSKFAIEVRPKKGKWHPFFVGIPIIEEIEIEPKLEYNIPGRVPFGGSVVFERRKKSEDNKWLLIIGNEIVSDEKSCFIICKKLPTKVIFGETDDNTKRKKYLFNLDKINIC